MAIQKNQSKITQNILLGCTPNIGSQFHSLLIFGEWGEISVKTSAEHLWMEGSPQTCQHVCCDSQWPWQWGLSTVTIHSQLPRHNCPDPKLNKSKCSQFWMDWSCFLEKSSWKFIIYMVCVWKCVLLGTTEVPQKPSPSPQSQCSSSRWRIREQRGDLYLAQTLPTCCCRQASLSSLPLPLAVFSKECWNFMSSCSLHP